MILRLLPASLALGLLGGCASFISWPHRQGLDYFVGRPQPALVAALGTPSRQWSANGVSYLAYDFASARFVSGEPGTRTPDTEVPYGPWADAARCVTTFRVTGGTVQAWSLDGGGCRGAPFPAVRAYAATALAQVPNEDVRGATTFPYEAYTGQSAVDDGKFYSQ